jgi:hypothetical protein
MARNPDPQGQANCIVGRSPTLVKDRVQYEPNYDAKRQTGMETAQNKVCKKVKPQSNLR